MICHMFRQATKNGGSNLTRQNTRSDMENAVIFDVVQYSISNALRNSPTLSGVNMFEVFEACVNMTMWTVAISCNEVTSTTSFTAYNLSMLVRGRYSSFIIYCWNTTSADIALHSKYQGAGRKMEVLTIQSAETLCSLGTKHSSMHLSILRITVLAKSFTF